MKFHEAEQGSEAWLTDRLWKATASEINKIFTPKGALSKQSEGYIKKLILEGFHPNYSQSQGFMGNEHTDRGHEFEPVAAEWFANNNPDVDVREAPFISSDSFGGLVGCSPDRLLYKDADTPKEEPFAGLEIKCPKVETHYEYLIEGILPPSYKPQVHTSMIVTGLNHWHFVSFNAYAELEENTFLPHFHTLVERDEYTEQLEKALGKFIETYAERNKKIRSYIK